MTALTLHVDLGARSYPIHIGPGLLQRKDVLRSHIAGSQVMIVTNETVAPLYLETVKNALIDVDIHVTVLPDGERYKDMATLESIFDNLMDARCDRETTVVALGGGVVGDIAGFAAACYQRGVPYIQIPTTLLAQVDSSVGGKTAVNHPRGKNMIGAFYQPRAVIADTDTLATLADRELRAGIAEVIKYGLIRDTEFLAWLEQHVTHLLARDPGALTFAINRSCQAKADVVATDERERGERALLNLGHTFGHAIETAVGYGQWLHGEAVAVGMVMAVFMSAHLKHLSKADYQRVLNLVAQTGLPVAPPADITRSQLLSFMQSDKKVSAGRVRLVLLKKLGHAYLSDDYPPTALDDTLRHFQVTG
jgi:3-dehydroquinate synthase